MTDEPDGARFLELWETACALEDMLTDTAKRRVSGELEAAETALADSADVSSTALADLSDDDVDELDDPDDLREGRERDSDPP